MENLNNKSSQSQTRILRQYSFLGQHHVVTNKGEFILDYKEITPTPIDTNPKVIVTFRDEKGKVYSSVNWNRNSYLSEEIIINTIK